MNDMLNGNDFIIIIIIDLQNHIYDGIIKKIMYTLHINTAKKTQMVFLVPTPPEEGLRLTNIVLLDHPSHHAVFH